MRTVTVSIAIAALALLAAPAWSQPASLTKPEKPKVKSLDATQRAALKQQLKALFKAADEPSTQQRILDQLKAYPAVTRSRANSTVKSCFRYAQVGFRIPNGGSFKFKMRGKAGEGTVHKVGSGSPGKGLFFGMHGGGVGVGDGRNAMQKWVGASKCVMLFPTVFSDMHWSNRDAQLYILGLLRAAIRTWRIDTNRVYMAGHSMGGFGTWSIGSQNADQFAALSPVAGGGYGPGLTKNLFNTPIYFYHSLDDPRVGPKQDIAAAKALGELKKDHPKGYKHIYKEYKNIGHGVCPGGHSPIMKWMMQFKRNPYPKKLVWEPNGTVGFHKKQFAWLRSDNPTRHREIVAELTRTNQIEIKCSSPSGLTILLNPKLVSFSKPLKIIVNGELKYNAYPTYSVWACAVSTYLRNDQKQYFVGHVTLE